MQSSTASLNWTFTIGERAFVLDKTLANQVLAGKKTINGKVSEAFNLLPLRYPWAYDLYVLLKQKNWGPYAGEIPTLVREDVKTLGFIETAVGFMAPRGACPESRIIGVIREKVTAPELKLTLGRRSQEENIGLDCFLFLTDRFKIDPSLCSRAFLTAPAVRQIFDLCGKVADSVSRSMPLATPEDQRKLARAIFFLGACFKGVQFRSLQVKTTDPKREGFPALSKIFANRGRDEDFHVEFLRRLFLNLLKENPDIRGADFDKGLIALMEETVSLERRFVRELLAGESDNGSIERLNASVDLIAGRRLADFGLRSSFRGAAPGARDDCGQTRFAADFHNLDTSSFSDPTVSDDEL